MPSKNRIKNFEVQSYYHVYNRGVEKRRIFLHESDYAYFLHLIDRYLGASPVKNPLGGEYTWFEGRAELLAICLMQNHYHLLLYQEDVTALTELMHRIATAYTGYFNKKYARVGPLFQDRFRASYIQSEPYLLHVSRYIHLNPRNYDRYEWSSLPYYLLQKSAPWIQPSKILDFFDGDYALFVGDYKAQHEALQALKQNRI